MLDTTQWKWHRIGDLFDLEIGKNKSQENLPDGEGYFYVGAKKGNNGVMLECGYDPSLISKRNCIVFICNGQGSVGYANYMDRDFIATSDVVMGYSEHLTTGRGLFLVTVIDMERPKYSFGRKWKIHLEDTQIKLPTTRNGSVDWMWIDSYMAERIGEGCPKTANSSRKNPVNTTNWGKFRIGDFFEIHPTKFINGVSSNDCTEMGVPLVANSAVNNGVVGLCDMEPTEDGGIVTFSDTTDGNTFFYQDKPFIGFAHVQGMYPLTRKWSKLELLFLNTLLMFDARGRYNYGRKMRRDSIANTTIRLPVDENGNPDWAWINSYMKSLPYGDKI